MTPVHELLSKLSTLGVVLWPDGNFLSYEAPEGVITPAILEEMAKHKPRLLQALTSTSLEALPHECPCLWNEPRCLDDPCARCALKGLCPKCGRCRTCWQHRVLSRVKERPRG
jgi:hypothetical protein